MVDETKIKQFCKDAGYNHIKKCGLAATIMAFYSGSKLEWFKGEDFEEIASQLNLSSEEYNYWKDLFKNKNSWLNKED